MFQYEKVHCCSLSYKNKLRRLCVANHKMSYVSFLRTFHPTVYIFCKLTEELRLGQQVTFVLPKGQKHSTYRDTISTGSTSSIEPVDFWKRHNGTCEITKIIRIESVNFKDKDTLKPVISQT